MERYLRKPKFENARNILNAGPNHWLVMIYGTDPGGTSRELLKNNGFKINYLKLQHPYSHKDEEMYFYYSIILIKSSKKFNQFKLMFNEIIADYTRVKDL